MTQRPKKNIRKLARKPKSRVEGKSGCPYPLNEAIRVSNAFFIFKLAKPEHRFEMEKAFRREYRAATGLQKIEEGLDNAEVMGGVIASSLTEAISIRQRFERFDDSVKLRNIEVVRILQHLNIDRYLKAARDLAVPDVHVLAMRLFSVLSKFLILDGFASPRLKLCEICGQIFWAKRITTRYCDWRGNRCYKAWNQRQRRKRSKEKSG